MAQTLLQVYASINGSLEQTNPFALVVGKHLVLPERGTIVIIVDLFSVIHALIKSVSRLPWHPIPTNPIVSVIIVLTSFGKPLKLTLPLILLLIEEEV